jgi:predicted MFS family arabinose efflux permease
VLTDHIGWRWIFWCNVPACIAIGWVLFLRLPRSTVHKREPVDIAGAVTLTAALLPALAALSWAGEGISIREPRMLMAICGAIFFGYWFILNERRAVRPIVALHLFRHLTFTLAMLAMFGVAVAMYAALSYAPLLFQQRMGMSASQSGAVTAPLVLTLSVTAAVAGRMVGRGAGHRNISVLGMAIAAAALGWLSFLPHNAGKLEATLAMALFGAGLGFTMPTLMLAAQGAVPHGHIGITAALAKFFRSVGGLVGVVAAGAAIRYFQTVNTPAADAITSMIACAALAMLATLLLTLLLPERKNAD